MTRAEIEKIRKLRALADRPGSAAEGTAARAAIKRIEEAAGRRNPGESPDVRRRRLERLAAQGDLQAAEALLGELRRAGELRFSLDGVLETVRAKPGLTRREIAFWWGMGKGQGGSLLAELERVFLVHKDDLGRWWPGPDVRRTWESPWYGCYPVDALSDTANRIPLRPSNPRATLRALKGCLGLLVWAEGQLQQVLDEVGREWLAAYVSDLRGMVAHLESGGRWHRGMQEGARGLRTNLLGLWYDLTDRNPVPLDTWCEDPPAVANPDGWTGPPRRPEWMSEEEWLGSFRDLPPDGKRERLRRGYWEWMHEGRPKPGLFREPEEEDEEDLRERRWWCNPDPETQPNPDVTLRELERAAAQGDAKAGLALLRFRHRADLLPRTPFEIDMLVAAARGVEGGVYQNEHVAASDEWELVSGVMDALRKMAREGYPWPYIVSTEYFDIDIAFVVNDDRSLRLGRLLSDLHQGWEETVAMARGSERCEMCQAVRGVDRLAELRREARELKMVIGPCQQCGEPSLLEDPDPR